MSATLLRVCAGLSAATLLAGAAGAQSTVAQASTVDCSDVHSSPVASTAVCAAPPANGLSATSGATVTYAGSAAGGDVAGAQVTLRADDFAGAGGNTFDFLTFSGATPPARVFVYFLASVDASALSQNENTLARGDGAASIAYGSGLASVRRTATDDFWTDPTITDIFSSNLTLDGAAWRAAFDYAGPGAFFNTNVGVFGELLSFGGETPLAGAGSGRAAIQLLGFGVADAEGNSIGDASCSFRSQTPCNMITVAVTATPEPSAFLLLATGLLGVVGVARRATGRRGAAA